MDPTELEEAQCDALISLSMDGSRPVARNTDRAGARAEDPRFAHRKKQRSVRAGGWVGSELLVMFGVFSP